MDIGVTISKVREKNTENTYGKLTRTGLTRLSAPMFPMRSICIKTLLRCPSGSVLKVMPLWRKRRAKSSTT